MASDAVTTTGIDFLTECNVWINIIESRYDKNVAVAFKSELLDEWYDIDEDDHGRELLMDNIEVDDWSDSAFMMNLHEQSNAFSNYDFCETFFQILKKVINGQIVHKYDDIITPKDIDWSYKDNKVKIKESAKYMARQCPIFRKETDKSLSRLIAVGMGNNIPLLSIFCDIFDLSRNHLLISNSNKIKEVPKWIENNHFFNNAHFKHSELVCNAICEYKHRLGGNGIRRFIPNKIEDDVNVYIEYIVLMNKIISNILLTKTECCPLQIDVVILGKEHAIKQKTQNVDDNEYSSDDEDDEDDEKAFDELIRKSMDSSNDRTELINGLPKDGIAAFLKQRGVKCISTPISLTMQSESRVLRNVQELICEKLNNRRRQRIIVCIDRTSRNGMHNNEGMDMLIVFQLDGFDEIGKEYSKYSMSWMTKNYIFPDWRVEQKNVYVGSGLDFGDNAFVFSFHVHSENNIECEQYIKSDRIPFLPHYMIDVWPMYFDNEYREVRDEFDLEYVCEQWKLRCSDEERLMIWIKIIEPKLYAYLEMRHLKFVK